MILKAVLINRTEVWTDPRSHYDAMRAWLDSHVDKVVQAMLEKQLDDGVVDLDFGYVNITPAQFIHHQFESSERRGERWVGAFRPQPLLHDDPSEFTHERFTVIDEATDIDTCKFAYICDKVKGNNK